jgi:hypothetical protein
MELYVMKKQDNSIASKVIPRTLRNTSLKWGVRVTVLELVESFIYQHRLMATIALEVSHLATCFLPYTFRTSVHQNAP